jgi:hypothetical protein
MLWEEQMHTKLITGTVLLILSIVVSQSMAADQGSAKANASAPGKIAKCWKRDKPFEGTGNAPVCRAYEQVLNTTCEQPDKLRCNWTLPPGEKRFKKLKWKTLDWREYWELIGDMRKSGVREDLRTDLWKREEAKIRKRFEEGTLKISTAMADLDHNGRNELIIKNDLLPCYEDDGGTMFAVMDPETKRLDWRFRQMLLGPNASHGAEIMLYDGRAFLFGWDPNWKQIDIWEGFGVGVGASMTESGRLNVCTFKYIKEDK